METKTTVMLPKLPLPGLLETLDKYLDIIRAVISPEQFERTKRLVEEFAKPDGLGNKLQEKLTAYAETKDNWATDLWRDDFYLKSRLPLIIYSNVGLLLPRTGIRDRPSQLWFAAKLISSAADCCRSIYMDTLPVDQVHRLGKRAPLCMEQYRNFFHSCRRPGLQKDEFVKCTGNHIIVAYRNQFFALDLYFEDKPLSTVELYDQLTNVVKAVDSDDRMEEPVGIFTAAPRDKWFDIWTTLVKIDPANEENLDLMESSMFVLSLDNDVQGTANCQSPGQLGSPETEEVRRGKQITQGYGSGYNTCNRWLDKACQFIVGDKGSFGLSLEHTPAEGIVIFQILERIIATIENIQEEELDKKLVTHEKPQPKRLRWKLNAQLKEDMNSIRAETDRLIATLDLHVLRYDKYGKEFPKKMKISPDAYMQLALQLTYFKIHKCLRSSYESASLRRFRSGRVDNIRSCTMEALDWCQAMTSTGRCSIDTKMKLLRTAIEKQTTIIHQTILGYGVDNHLLGLREMAVELGIGQPEIFKDESYKQFNSYGLGTSQATSNIGVVPCYAPMEANGYGACYNLQPHSIVVSVSSYLFSEAVTAEVFAKELESSLTEMHDLCVKAGEPSNQSACDCSAKQGDFGQFASQTSSIL